MPGDVVWLASFPKSGNTWFRFLLANLRSNKTAPVAINLPLNLGDTFTSREMFDALTMIDSGLLTHDEADLLRPLVYERLAAENRRGAESGAFVKVHDAYTLNQAGEPVLGRTTARAAIYIIRDPRDVAVSWAHHEDRTIGDSVAAMNSPESELATGRGRQHRSFRQKLLTWSGHVASWLNQRDIPVHTVRYEDLKSDTVAVFSSALQFLGESAAPSEIEKAVRNSEFSELQKQENQEGFKERYSTRSPFFRRGEQGNWRQEMTGEQAAKLVEAHGNTMRRFGYVP